MSNKITLIIFSDKSSKPIPLEVHTKLLMLAFYLSCVVVGAISYLIIDYINLVSLQKDYYQAIKSEAHLRSEATLVNAHLDSAKLQLQKVDGFVKNLEEMVSLKVNAISKNTGIGPLTHKEDAIRKQNTNEGNISINSTAGSDLFANASKSSVNLASSKEYNGINESFKPKPHKTILGISVEDFVLKPLVDEIDNLERIATNHSNSLKNLLITLQKKQYLLSSIPIGKPAQGWIASSYGYRISPFTGRRSMHYGIDIAAPVGTPIYSPADGVVIFSGTKSGFGKFLMIAHDHGIVTKYGHNSDLFVKIGEKVFRGDPIAAIGSTGRSTGPHLHYEIWINGKPKNPYNFMLQNSISLNM